jgi:putative membrane protein
MYRYLLLAGAAALLVACNPPANNTEAAASAAQAADSSAAAAASAADAAASSAVDATASAAQASVSGAAASAAATTPDFVTAAASTDMFEIQAARLAEKRSKNADVKAFAAMMIHDHTQSTAALKAAIKASGATVSLPTDLPTDKKAKLDELTSAAPADFDKAYMESQVMAHQDALTVMKAYAAGGDTPQIKDFAAKTALVVQMHLDKASNVRDSLK